MAGRLRGCRYCDSRRDFYAHGPLPPEWRTLEALDLFIITDEVWGISGDPDPFFWLKDSSLRHQFFHHIYIDWRTARTNRILTLFYSPVFQWHRRDLYDAA
jgi:hypothetical protein